LNGSHYYRLFLAIGPGSNIKAKLLVIWGLLSFASYLHISEIMVDGDSKNILDWFEGRYQLQVPLSFPRSIKFWRLKYQFSWIQSFHFHRQFNTLADSLSKKVMVKMLGGKTNYFIGEFGGGTAVYELCSLWLQGCCNLGSDVR
jgi:hypothetical protein